MKYIATHSISLIEALAALAPDSSKTTLRSWLKEGRVTVAGEVVKLSNTQVLAGQEVAIGARPRFTKSGLRFYYEDPHLIVIEKPVGMLSVATAFEKGETLHALLKAHYRPKRVFVVHRLDQETSGVMLFALSEEAQQRLKDNFEKHELERCYLGVVEGYLEEESGTWKSYLYEDEKYVVHSSDDPSRGRVAITHYLVLNKVHGYTLLRLTLETGRKNQIRVHCRDAGHPIVGDKKYGAHGDPMKRLGLHAQLLAFTHPMTRKKLRFESPVPDAFQRYLPKGDK